MSVLAFREVLPRTFRHRFGDPPQAERKFTVSLTAPVANQQILDSVGIFFGALHPEYPYLRCVEGNVTETDRHYAEVTYRYELPPRGSQQFDPNPLARPDVWSFSTGGAMIPATFCYAGPNNVVVPLTNTAGEFIEGLTRPEAEVRVTISGNRPTFDYVLASQITNCINGLPYLGGGPYTWMCSGISGSPQSEVVNDVEITYWTFTTELIFRESTHLLFIPNVGFHKLTGASAEPDAGDDAPEGKPAASGTSVVGTSLPRTSASGIKRLRATVKDDEDNDIPCTAPVPLDTTGDQKADGLAPDILVRRVHRVINFAQFFGVPPF